MSYAPSVESRTDAQGKSIPWFPLIGNDHPIAPDLASAIAGVVIEWSAFEGALRADLGELMQFAIVRGLADQYPRAFKKRIELWKRSVHTLFPNVPCYLEVADEICSKGKIVAHHRNRLIHGHWLPPEGDGSEYRVMLVEGLDRIYRLDQLTADVGYVSAIRKDIKTLSDALVSFTTTRMLHGRLGLLRARPAPAPEHPAQNCPPTPEKP